MFRSLKIRNYRLYFIGQAISLCGTWMQTIGQDWLVLKLTNSGTALGIVSALQFLPMLLLGPLGGMVADQFNKRKILYVTQTAAGLLALTLGIIVAAGTVKIWMVYLLALGLGLVNLVDMPTRQAFVPEMVDRDHLTNAVTLNSTEVNLARAVGPALSGIVIVVLSIASCFFINAVSYIAAITAFALMNGRELHATHAIAKGKHQILEGFRYARSSPVIRDTLLMMAIVGTFAYEFSVSLPLVARFTFHGNAGTYAMLVAATGVGSIIGGLFTASRKQASRRMFIGSSLFFGVTLILASIMPSLFLSVAALVFAGVFSINFISLGNTILQLESRPEMRGRIMALWSMGFLGSTPIGGPIIGWIGEFAGARWGLGVGGAAAIIAAAFGVFAITHGDRKRPVAETIGPALGEISVGEKTKI